MQDSLADALPSFAQLAKILKGYDRRGNFLGLFFTDAFMPVSYTHLSGAPEEEKKVDKNSVRENIVNMMQPVSYTHLSLLNVEISV